MPGEPTLKAVWNMDEAILKTIKLRLYVTNY